MKPPEQTIIGGARKTLPTRSARKLSKANPSPKKKVRENRVTPEQEQEWVKIFDQK